jgi:uncharacterized protein YbjT (DUF2867 family)
VCSVPGVRLVRCCAVEQIIAFVAGATGYTGRAVVRALARQGARVVAHVRPDSPRMDAWRDRFGSLGAEVDDTAWDADAMTRTLQGLAPTHVFALLGTTRARAKHEGMGATEAYEKIDYGLTALLVDAAAQCSVLPRFVYLSAAGVAQSSSNPYVRARWRAEQHLRESGLPWTIARPSFITGEDRDERRPLERLGATISDRMLSVAGALGARKLRDRYRSTDNTTLAEGLVRIALDPARESRIVYSEDLR